jgi:hypothetical protein
MKKKLLKKKKNDGKSLAILIELLNGAIQEG